MSNSNDSAEQKSSGSVKLKLIILGVVIAAVAGLYYFFGDQLSLENLAQQETALRNYQQQHPLLVYGIAFLVYVAITGMSLPGAAALSLLYAWYFGFYEALVLLSFASTLGATVAFLLSRYFFRDMVLSKFGDRLEKFNQSLETEGPFYLFTLRLIPAVPFFIINAVMGLTPMKTHTFWWVSQIGMLAGTIVYTYAGSSVPDLNTLAEHGLQAVFSPAQIAQIFGAFALLGVFPFLARYAIKLFMGNKADDQTSTP